MATVLAVCVAALFRIVRGVFDIAARRYAWAAAGIVAAVVVLLTLALVPLQTQSVKIDLPMSVAPR